MTKFKESFNVINNGVTALLYMENMRSIIISGGDSRIKKMIFNEGKKILCFFAPSCEHCQATAKELTEMRKTNPDFPEIQIIFMDEAPEEIPNFFKFAGASYSYKVIEIIEFWNAIGNEKNVPGVCYLWNGNIMKFYEGTEGKNQFSKSDLKLQLQKIKK